MAAHDDMQTNGNLTIAEICPLILNSLLDWIAELEIEEYHSQVADVRVILVRFQQWEAEYIGESGLFEQEMNGFPDHKKDVYDMLILMEMAVILRSMKGTQWNMDGIQTLDIPSQVQPTNELMQH